jgi:hypothetical protein
MFKFFEPKCSRYPSFRAQRSGDLEFRHPLNPLDFTSLLSDFAKVETLVIVMSMGTKRKWRTGNT